MKDEERVFSDNLEQMFFQIHHTQNAYVESHVLQTWHAQTKNQKQH